MESKKRSFDAGAVTACLKKIKEEATAADIVSTVVLLAMFMFYTLTFFVPKFYGLTEKYVGVIVFAALVILFLLNVSIIGEIRSKNVEFIALALLVAVTGVNILIVKSGFGCFFVMADFAMIVFLSSRIRFAKWQVYLFGGLYVLMTVYWFAFVYTWMFADYESFAMNTNTAATFTVFSILCVLVFFDALYQRYRIAGLFIVIALVKCLQISLYHRSRGAFVMLFAYLALRFLIPSKLWEKKGFFNGMLVFSTLGSLVFVALYVAVASAGVNFRMPFFYKNIFSGREAIWLEFWNLFKAKPLTGIGTNVTITSFFEFNVHNAMYNILVIHGLIVFALTMFLIFRIWGRCREGIGMRNVARLAMVAVFAVCIESFTDVDLIWTDYSINMIFLLLVMNSKSDFKE